MKKATFGILILVLFIVNSVHASKISKAFDALKVYNYFDAKRLFEKTLPIKTSAAAYGLGVIYSADKSPFANIDSAYKYILIASNAFKFINKEYKAEYSEYNVTKKSIDSVIDIVHRKAFDKVKNADKVSDLNTFIDKFTTAPQKEEAINIRNNIAFSAAKKINSHEAYNNFIGNYPKSKELAKAKGLYEARLYESFTSENTIIEYKNFIYSYPNSPYAKDAYNGIYALSTINETINEFRNFIIDQPKNPNVEKAWREIYYLSTIDGKTSSFLKFEKVFPDFPYSGLLFKDLELSKKTLYPVRENKMWGFCDKTGTIIITCKYEWVGTFSEGLAACGLKDKSGFIDKAGELIIPAIYEEVERFSNGLAIVQKEDKYGVVNKISRLVVAYEYDDISDFSEGYAVVEKNEKYGYINKRGKLIIPTIYTKAGDFSEGLAGVELNGKSGYISPTGAKKISLIYDWVNEFKDGLAKVKSANKFGLINKRGVFVLPFEYDFLGEFSENAIMVVKADKYGFSNDKGLLIVPLEYDFTGQSMLSLKFKNNMVIAQKDGKQGIIDRSGNYLTTKSYDRIGIFSHGLAAVKKSDKWGYIDVDMKLVIPHKYLTAKEFTDSIAKVTDELGKVGFINMKGEPIIDFIYDDAQQLKDGWIIVTIKDRKGLINISGKTAIPCKNDNITKISDNILKIVSNSNLAYFNTVSEKYIWNVGEF